MTVSSDEVHTKMCKKIAQLTKVIYNLHTKSEEHDNIIDILKQNHQKEIEKIALESENKYTQIKDQMDNYIKIERSYERLKCVFEEVKKENLSFEQKVKSTQESNEINSKMMKTDYENKYLDLQNKLLEQKQNYDELKLNFDNVLKTLDTAKHKQMTSISLQHHKEMEKLNKFHEKSIADMNQECENLKESLKKVQEEKELLQTDFETNKQELKSDYENKIKKLKEFHKNEKEAWKSSLSKELASSWEKEKEELLRKNKAIINNSELINTEQKYRINYLEKSIAEKEIQIENYQANCGSLDYQIKENLRKNLELEETIKQKDIMIDSLKNEISSSYDANERLNSLRKHLLEATNKIKSLEQKHTEEIKMKTAHVKSLEKTTSELTNQITNTKNELESCRQKTEDVEYESSIVKQKYADMTKEKGTLSSACKKISAELEDLKKLCQTYKDDLVKEKEKYSKEKEKMKKVHENEMNKVTEKHKSDIEHFKKESEKILKHSQGQLIDELTKNQEKICADQKAIIEERKSFIETLQTKYDKLKNEFENSERNLNKISKLFEEMKEREIELNKNIKGLTKDLNSSEVNSKSLKKTLAETTAQLSKEREEALTKQAKSLKDEQKILFEDYKNKLHSQHEAKISNIFESMKEEKQQLIEKLMLEHGREMEKVKYLKDEEINNLKHELDILNSNFEEEQQKSNISITKLEDEIKNLRKEIALINKHCEKEKTLKEEQMKEEYLANIETMKIKYEAEISKQKEIFEKKIKESDDEHELICSALKKQYVNKEKQSASELKEQFTKEKENIQEFLRVQHEETLKYIKNEYENKLNDLNAQLHNERQLRKKEFDVHTKKILEVSDDLEKSKNAFDSLQDELDAIMKQTMAIRKELELKVQEVLEVRRECNSRMRVRVDELSTDHRTVIDNIQANHMTEMRNMMKDFKDEKMKMQDQLSAYKILLEESEDRYSNRPSRDEDIEHIKHLQENLIQQDMYCQQLQEERKLFKLELVNREENFNRVFSSNPNVGFLDPIEMTKKKSAKKKEITARYSGK